MTDRKVPAWLLMQSKDPERRPKTNIAKLIGPTVLAFPAPTRDRWVAALNAGRFDVRYLDPDPDLDVDDQSIPDERFEFRLQVFLTDEGGFSSIQVPRSALGRRVDSESP